MQAQTFTHTQTISELDELREVVKGSDLEHTQLTPGPFHAQTTRINLGASFLDIGEYNRAIHAQGSIGSEAKTFLFALHQEASSNGFPVNREQFVAYGTGAMGDAYGDVNVKWMTLTIQQEEWLILCRDLDHWIKSLDQSRAFLVLPSPQTMAAILKTFHAVGELAVSDPKKFEQASIRALIHRELMNRMRNCLAESKGTHKEMVAMPLHKRFQIIKRTNKYILAHFDGNMTLADISENVEVSERVLQYTFRDVLDISPNQYLKTLRLNQARKELRQTTPDQTTVTELAAKCGFWHMGRFSRDYKAFFGELPSDTLRRRGK